MMIMMMMTPCDQLKSSCCNEVSNDSVLTLPSETSQQFKSMQLLQRGERQQRTKVNTLASADIRCCSEVSDTRDLVAVAQIQFLQCGQRLQRTNPFIRHLVAVTQIQLL
jgi:hypothetical protein